MPRENKTSANLTLYVATLPPLPCVCVCVCVCRLPSYEFEQVSKQFAEIQHSSHTGSRQG